MATQNIMLLEGPRFLRDMLKRVIARTPGLRIVADVADKDDFSKVASQIDVDWTIYVLAPGEKVPESVNRVANQYSSMHLMAIEADGGRVKLKWLEPHEVTLSEKNLQEILQILVENKPIRYLEGENMKRAS